MGDWNLNISGLGTHSPHVPLDQQTAEWASIEGRSTIARLREMGHEIKEAFLIHWPGQVHEVKENLITGEKVATGAAAPSTTTTGNAGADVQVTNAESATTTAAVPPEPHA